MSSPASTYYIDNNMDEYDFMSMDMHKYVSSSHSGKGRNKLDPLVDERRGGRAQTMATTVSRLNDCDPNGGNLWTVFNQREAQTNTNKHDNSGHCRKTVQKLVNNAHKTDRRA